MATPGTTDAVFVVPCFNEGARFSSEGFRALLADPRVGAYFVDDGSTDDTRQVLEAFRASAPDRVRVIALESNRGKAEAVRTGLRAALEAGASVVGYLDADLATPPEEAIRLLDQLISCGVDVVLGSRVGLLGTEIDRHAARHYLGRVFATMASIALDLRVYDTQCGAKVFRATPALGAALEQPFHSRWAFDVELLGRLRDGTGSHRGRPTTTFREVPLRVWRDVAGSKLNPVTMVRSAADLVWIGVDLRLRRRAHVPRARGD